MTKRFTGRHMALILVGFFGVIVAVNVTMARFASSTFGGIVVANSYVASERFNGWLEQAKAQQALGWQAVTAWRPDGRIAVTVTGPGEQARLTATARSPLGRKADLGLAFAPLGGGRFLSDRPLPEGRWIVRLEIVDGAQTWRREETLQ